MTIKQTLRCAAYLNLVRLGGLEPPQLAPPPPQDGVSTIPPQSHFATLFPHIHSTTEDA